MSKNMFAVFASDSEGEEGAKTETKQHTTKGKQTKSQPTKPAAQKQPQGKETGDNRDVQAKDTRGRGRGGRGRGDRGDRGVRARGDRGTRGERGYRGRGGRGDYEERYEEGGERQNYRGRGERGARRGGRYRGGERGTRGTRGDKREVYSHLATKDQVIKEGEEEKGEPNIGENRHRNYPTHEGYDKRSGTGYGKEVRKGGMGKGGWGNPDYERTLEHKDADVAAEIAEEGHPDVAGEVDPSLLPAEETKEKPAQEAPAAPQEEEEDDTKMSAKEFLEKRKKEHENLKKPEARKPEEITVKNIEKHSEGKKTDKLAGSTIKSHESYAPTKIKSEVELGFGAAPAEEEEEEYYPRGGRGRGGRGRGGRDRGGFQGGRGNKPRGRGGKKFTAADSDFPSL